MNQRQVSHPCLLFSKLIIITKSNSWSQWTSVILVLLSLPCCSPSPGVSLLSKALLLIVWFEICHGGEDRSRSQQAIGCQRKATLGWDNRGTGKTTVDGIPYQRWSDTESHFTDVGDHNLPKKALAKYLIQFNFNFKKTILKKRWPATCSSWQGGGRPLDGTSP